MPNCSILRLLLEENPGEAPCGAVVMTEALETVSRPARTCGFRMSVVDAVIQVTGAAAGWLLWERLGSLSLLFPVVVAHFFLFCNVFRVRRSYELMWAAAFVVNFAAWSVARSFSWVSVLLTQLPITAALIGAKVASDRYHGIGCRRLGRPKPQAGPSIAGGPS